jgi:hypothetical protein
LHRANDFRFLFAKRKFALPGTTCQEGMRKIGTHMLFHPFLNLTNREIEGETGTRATQRLATNFRLSGRARIRRSPMGLGRYAGRTPGPARDRETRRVECLVWAGNGQTGARRDARDRSLSRTQAWPFVSPKEQEKEPRLRSLTACAIRSPGRKMKNAGRPNPACKSLMALSSRG